MREYLQELIAVNQALEKELLEHRKLEAGLGKDLVNHKLEELSPAFIYAQAGGFQDPKMEAVSRLAGGMAHELNNQLMVICACIDIHMPGLFREESLRRALSRIRNSARICADLIRQLLLFSCQSPLFKVPTDLNQRVIRMGKILPRLLGGNIAIRLEISPLLWQVSADTTALNRAIGNLVLNARDAMPEGGTLTLKTENVCVDRSGATALAAGRFVCLTVTDTGAGIDEANLSRIFEPFFTTKEPGKGIGLGLSVTYGVIKAHDGWIEVDSAPGRGSAFRLNIPALPPETEAPSDFCRHPS